MKGEDVESSFRTFKAEKDESVDPLWRQASTLDQIAFSAAELAFQDRTVSKATRHSRDGITVVTQQSLNEQVRSTKASPATSRAVLKTFTFQHRRNTMAAISAVEWAVGIDVAKATFDAAFMDEAGKVHHKQFANRPQGFIGLAA